MLDFKLHTPIGVKDLLAEETRVKKAVCRKIEKTFESYGYNEVESPMYEYIEVFSDEKMGSISPKEMFRFFDKNGSLLALRSDMTPPIARIAATQYQSGARPLRFCYFGNAFRDSESYQGKRCEYSQAGIELMGAYGAEADAEVIAIAVKSILSSGIKELKLNIGQVKFFNAILSETGFGTDVLEELKSVIAHRNYVGMEKILENNTMPESTKQLFTELPKLVGGRNIIEYTRKLTSSKEALEALDEMENLYDLLEVYGVDKYVSFDLSMVNKLNYYTGIIFRGYTYGTGYSIIDGGRYDNLVSQFGKNMPAVGFGIKIDEVTKAAYKENPYLAESSTKSMIASSKEGKKAAVQIAESYRANGLSVETSFITGDFHKNVNYMKEMNYDSLLYFKDSENITYVRNTEEYGIIQADIKKSDLVINSEEEV